MSVRARLATAFCWARASIVCSSARSGPAGESDRARSNARSATSLWSAFWATSMSSPAIGQPRERRQRGRLVLGVSGDAAERSVVGSTGQRLGANRVGRVALGDRRQPAWVSQQPCGRQGRARVLVAGGREGQKPVGRAVASLRVGIGRRDAPKGRSVDGSGHSGPSDPGVRVGLGQDGQLDRLVQFAQRLPAERLGRRASSAAAASACRGVPWSSSFV